MQLIVSQEPDRLVEVLRQGLHPEVRPSPLAGSYRVQCLLEGYTIELLAAVAQQLLQDLADSFASGTLFGFGSVADMSSNTDGIADILRLNDQGQSVRQCADDRVHGGGWNGQTMQRLFRPTGQLNGFRLAQRDGFAAAKPGAFARWPAGALGQHHRCNGVVQIEVFARDAVDIRQRDFLDALEVLIGGAQAI